MGRFKPSCPKQVLGTFWPKTAQNLFLHTYLFQTRFGAPICPKLSNTYFGALIYPKHILRHIFSKTVKNCFSKTIQKIVWPKPILGHLFVQNCPKIILRHRYVQNLFLVNYLSKTTENLFKDFEGYIEKASNLVFCYQILRKEQGDGLSVQRIYQYLVNCIHKSQIQK